VKQILSESEIIEAIRAHYELDPKQSVTLSSSRKRGAPAAEYSALVEDLDLFPPEPSVSKPKGP